MKAYLSVLAAMLFFSSCIKVEDANPNYSACGMSNNSFRLDGYSNRTNFVYIPYSGSQNNYNLFFVDTVGGTAFSIYFHSRPSSGSYAISNYSVNSLASNQCFLEYQNGNNYIGYTGSVSVNVSGSNINIGFCSTAFDDGYDVFTASGYFTGR